MIPNREILVLLGRSLRLGEKAGVCPLVLNVETRYFSRNESNFFRWLYRANVAFSYIIQSTFAIILWICWNLTISREMPIVAFMFVGIAFLLHGFTMFLDYMWGWGPSAGLPVYLLNSVLRIFERLDRKRFL